MEKPLFRADIQPVSAMVGGRQVVTFMDPLRLTKNSIAVDMKLFPLLRLLDGKHDLRDIQRVMTIHQQGQIVYLSEVESFIESLDKAFLLNSELFRKKMGNLREEFNSQPDRHPILAGRSYESDPDRLGRFIEEVERSLPQNDSGGTEKNITGILAPHIDIIAAKTTYINLYRWLKGKNYSLVIIFGINHQPQDGLYSISEKNYITPFGKLESDKDFISELKKKIPVGTLSSDDFCHKMEHSIEFQTIFLHYYLEEPISIVPILCGGIHEFTFQKRNIFDDARFMGMVETLEEMIKDRNGNVLLISGVDFSHVGPKFGNQMPADAILSRAKSNDQKIISSILKGEPEKIYKNAVETQDQFNVCGLPSILIFSRLLKGSKGELLSHETYNETATSSAVTYASMIFTGGT
ncbi:MAG: AmmeMemoRadiSam system protein B [Syntrophales bacterium]|nr:AmmeMemoRadiSam system protein B [Syntrophales bacterium]